MFTSSDQDGLTDLDEINIYFSSILDGDIDNDGILNGPFDPDTDGDLVLDGVDKFPADPTEWEDTDGDGTGNNADPDDDNDRMPDNWEIYYGLNPLVNDAAADFDGDGLSNLKEHYNIYQIYHSDFESANDGWLEDDSTTYRWDLSTLDSHSSSHSWFVGMELSGRSAYLESPEIIWGDVRAELSFWYKSSNGILTLRNTYSDGSEEIIGTLSGTGGEWKYFTNTLSKQTESISSNIEFHFYSTNNGAACFIDDFEIYGGTDPRVVNDAVEANSNLKSWAGYFVNQELYPLLQSGRPDLETYARKMGEYANIPTRVIQGTWDTPEELKANLKECYNSGMEGAVLVGELPVAFVMDSPSSLYYEDMDGTWTKLLNSENYKIPSDPEVARQNSPEIYVGLLRPPTTSQDTTNTVSKLSNYFSRALLYTEGDWTHSDAVILVHQDFNIDPTNIKIWLEQKYLPFIAQSYYIKDGSPSFIKDRLNNYDSAFNIYLGHTAFNRIGIRVNNDEDDNVLLTTTIRNEISFTAPFHLLGACDSTRFVELLDDGTIIEKTNDYIAGHISFDDDGWGLGTFGYSGIAGGGVPGVQGFIASLNQGYTIGYSIIEWGNYWSSLPNPIDDYDLASGGGGGGTNEEYYKLNYIGDPLLKSY